MKDMWIFSGYFIDVDFKEFAMVRCHNWLIANFDIIFLLGGGGVMFLIENTMNCVLLMLSALSVSHSDTLQEYKNIFCIY